MSGLVAVRLFRHRVLINMKADILCHLLAALYWSAGGTLAQERSTSTQELSGGGTDEDHQENTESGASKKFFLPPIIHEYDHDDHDDHDDFYPKPHLPPLFYPFIHHHEPDHYHKPKPPPKPIHKPEHHKPPPIVIHHKPIHKPVHIHIHKRPLHVVKPPHRPTHHHSPAHHYDHHNPAHHDDHHNPAHHYDHHNPAHHYDHHNPAHHDDHHNPAHHDEHHKPVHHGEHHNPAHHDEHHKPVHHDELHQPVHILEQQKPVANGTKLEDGIETINLYEEEVYELPTANEDDTKYSVDQNYDQSYLYSQLESDGNVEKYEVTYPEKPYNNPSKPNPQNSDGSGIRRPIVSLSDFVSEVRPVPWYSQHKEEREPARKPLSGNSSELSNPDHDKTHEHHERPCLVYHHHHYYRPIPHHESHHHEHPHVPHHHPHHPPHKPHHPVAAQREDSNASSTESSLAETVDPKITIPYNEYDVSTEATAEEEKPGEESHSQKPTRKSKPKPSYRPISEVLLWPFTPKPARTKASKKPQTTENDKKNEGSVEDRSGDEDTILPDLFELK